MKIEIIQARLKHRKLWLAQRRSLWPDQPEEKLLIEQRDILMSEDQIAFLAFSDKLVLGLAEASLKPFPDLCKSQPNAYFQGWYVVSSFRKKGIGMALLMAVEKWAKMNNCKELVSSTTEDYPQSPQIHLAAGFRELKKPGLYFIKDLMRAP